MKDTRRTIPEWTGIPAARSSEAGLKARLALIVSLLSIASLSGLGSLALLLTQETPAPVAAAAPASLARGQADMVAERFMAGGDLTEVPVADGVSFLSDGVDAVSGPRWSGYRTIRIGDAATEEHTYHLVRATPEGLMPFELVVLMLIDPSGSSRPALASGPLLRRSNPISIGGHADYRELVDPQRAFPAGARERLSRWAAAWAEDDGATLGVLTGDPASGVRYLGLGGYSSAGIEVKSAIPLDGDSWVVRLRVILEDSILGGFSGGSHRISVDMDVTVLEASTGNPRIVGWGAPGAGDLGPESVRVSVAGR